jgi:hypothetical protein
MGFHVPLEKVGVSFLMSQEAAGDAMAAGRSFY